MIFGKPELILKTTKVELRAPHYSDFDQWRSLRKNSKAFLILIAITFLVISYYLLPTLYNKDLIQTEIKNQIYKKYNINIKFNEKVKYGLLPKPHFVAKNLSVILENKEIALVGTFKVNLKAKNFFSFNHVELKDLTFNKAIFNLYNEDLVFFEQLFVH